MATTSEHELVELKRALAELAKRAERLAGGLVPAILGQLLTYTIAGMAVGPDLIPGLS